MSVVELSLFVGRQEWALVSVEKLVAELRLLVVRQQ